MGEIADHVLIAHVLPVEQRANVVHAHAGKVLALDRFEIRAAALHAKDGNFAAAVIALEELDGGVAAAPDDQRGLGADESRRIHEEVEALERAGLGVVPARLHARPPYHSSGQTSGAREARPHWVSFARDGSARDAVHLDPIAAARRCGRQRLNAVGVRDRRRVEAAGVAEDRAALVLRLVCAVARAERGSGEATEGRALAGAVAALDDRAARSAEAGAEQRADGARQ